MSDKREEELCMCTSYIFRSYLFVLLFLLCQHTRKVCLLMADACKVAGGKPQAPAQPQDRRGST